jgi:DNA-binding NtrC family response regulator
LARKFAKAAAAKTGRREPQFAPSAIALLERMPWHGNVRELRNLIDRTVVLYRQDETRELTPSAITRDTLLSGESSLYGEAAGNDEPFEPPTRDNLHLIEPPETSPNDLSSQLREIERARVEEALTRTGWNQSKAARVLGITRAMLIHRIKTYGLARPADLNPSRVGKRDDER